MNTAKIKNIFWSLILGLAVSGVFLAASEFGLLTNWEFKTYDLRMALNTPNRPKPQNVVLFYVDEPSLRHMEGQGIHWPWPRELQGMAVKFCREGGAKAVIFDIFFSEDSVYGIDDDVAFAEGLKQGPSSYFALFLSKNEAPMPPQGSEIIDKMSIPFAYPMPKWAKAENSIASVPISAIADSATGFGNVQIPPDTDGIYRRMPPVENLSGTAVPSIALKVVSDITKPETISWPATERFLLSSGKIPLDNSGQMLINYYGKTDTFESYPLAEVLTSMAAIESGSEPTVPLSKVQNKIVIIGVAAPGLYDLKPTPLSRVYPGPEVHATLIENLLTSDFITPAGRLATAALILISGTVCAAGLTVIASSWGIAAWVILLLSIITGGSFLLFMDKVWIPVVAPSGAVALSSFAMLFKNYLTEGRKKREIRRAFGQYLSPEVVKEIAGDPSSLALGGVSRKISVFFSDIAGFTGISEKISPQELVKLLNDYFSKTTRIIQASGGTLDKYIGDAIMAFWGAPLPMPDHAARAVLSAIGIQKKLNESAELMTRIGIHTGEAVVGNIGSDIRFNYTAIGDSVNLASRLEGLNKKFGTNIIISESTYEMSRNHIEARKLGTVRVKGREKPVGIFEPLGEKGDFGRLSPEILSSFSQALSLFENGKFAEARKAFAGIDKAGNDDPSRYYQSVCGEYLKNPPADFDGVATFTSK